MIMASHSGQFATSVNNLNNIRLPTPSKEHIVNNQPALYKKVATFPSPTWMSLTKLSPREGTNFPRPECRQFFYGV
jgi:hypothetical protein